MNSYEQVLMFLALSIQCGWQFDVHVGDIPRKESESTQSGYATVNERSIYCIVKD